MNCKQGDLAIIVRLAKPEFIGMLVEVVGTPSFDSFHLPNGVYNVGSGGRVGLWIVKSLSGPFPHALGDGMYCTGHDHSLSPLRGDLLDDEIITSKELEAA